MRYLTSIVTAICAASCVVASAGNITLPDNRVLENAYVMSERPDGLEIGHKNGVMFVPFSDLPEAIQKKYGYNAEKAAKYQADVAAAKEKRAQEQAKKNADMAKAFAEDQKRVADMQFDRLGAEIQKSKERIEFLKTDIPRLEKSYYELVKKSSEMTAEAADTDTYYGGGWGGFLSKGGAKVTVRKQEARKLADHAADVKEQIEEDKDELKNKQDNLAAMQSKYDNWKTQIDTK